MFILLDILTKDYYPIVLMHGLGASPRDAQMFADWIHETYPEIYVHNIKLGHLEPMETWFVSMEEQVEIIARAVTDDPKLADGFIGLAHSQGGFALRHYLQVYNNPPMKRLITLSGPHGGFYCGVKSDCQGMLIPDFLMDIARGIEYKEFMQDLIGPLGYWRDPYNLEEFKTGSKSLAILDNSNVFNQTIKDNFLSLDLLVMTGGPNDGMIAPWQATRFGTWADGDDGKVVLFQDREDYKNDIFGLRTLHESGRLIEIEVDFSHNKYMNEVPGKKFFIDNILQYIPKEK